MFFDEKNKNKNTFLKPGLNKITMKNFTCKTMKQRAWHLLAIASFVPSYPTSTFSIRGNDDQNEGASPGTR
jgi:hypothetical protein